MRFEELEVSGFSQANETMSGRCSSGRKGRIRHTNGGQEDVICCPKSLGLLTEDSLAEMQNISRVLRTSIEQASGTDIR